MPLVIYFPWHNYLDKCNVEYSRYGNIYILYIYLYIYIYIFIYFKYYLFGINLLNFLLFMYLIIIKLLLICSINGKEPIIDSGMYQKLL
jgi:membrane-anchored protein YejM (alkaline phosphatase superfamily)